MTTKKAARTKLAPGEDSIERVVDALPSRGPHEKDISVRLWDGRLKRFKIRADTKGEFRRKARERVETALNSGSSEWNKGSRVIDFIDQVSMPVIASVRIRPNTLKRYELALCQVREQLKGLSIGDAVKFRTLERALQTVGAVHGSESARQARTVTSKYILDQMIRDGLIDHNSLRGISIDFGNVRKGHKAPGGHALTQAQYNRVVDHLVFRDITVPLPPGKDRRQTSINKHANTVALALLQAGTGLRISEALALKTTDAIITDDSVAIAVSAEVSKTHRGRTVPILDPRVENFWRMRLEKLAPDMPLIPAPGDQRSHWRTDNAVKACSHLYQHIGECLGDPAVSTMRSHGWRTVLNNLAIARGVPSEIRSAFFGHTTDMNAANYTDLTDVTSMAAVLKGATGV